MPSVPGGLGVSLEFNDHLRGVGGGLPGEVSDVVQVAAEPEGPEPLVEPPVDRATAVDAHVDPAEGCEAHQSPHLRQPVDLDVEGP